MIKWSAHVKVDEAFRLLKNLFHEKDIATSALDARLIVMDCLGLSHADLIADPDRPVCGEEKVLLEQAALRRLAFEPMSHILGAREFYGRNFFITPDVLTPRPDSEALIETSIQLLGTQKKNWRFLDLGTGSGCLLLTLLSIFEGAVGVGVELSAEALKVARRNTNELGLAARAEFCQGSWFKPVEGTFDLIISNPPYIETDQIKYLQKEVRDYEPHLALDGGADGVEPYYEIIGRAPDYLYEGGKLVLEIGHTQKQAVFDIFKASDGVWDMDHVCCVQDMEGRDRCIYAVR